MPTGPLPFCSHAGCPVRSRGLCPAHRSARAQTTDAVRGSRHQRGYGHQWVVFVAAFRRLLLSRSILPVCGARLSGVPSPHSQCAREGRLELEQLHCDHDPPLEDWERKDPARVCDLGRCGLLCRHCHQRKSWLEARQR
jgi:hypothetical protein